LSARAEKFARLERWAGAFEHHPLQMVQNLNRADAGRTRHPEWRVFQRLGFGLTRLLSTAGARGIPGLSEIVGIDMQGP
jgi:hypothetical protein